MSLKTKERKERKMLQNLVGKKNERSINDSRFKLLY